MYSAMSLSSLLKKEGKRSSPEGKQHVKLPKTKEFLASVLAGSSRLLMPIGLGDFNMEVGNSVKDEESVTYTEVPLYNMLWYLWFYFCILCCRRHHL